MSFQNHSFGIVNVYAPYYVVDHSHSWHSMASYLPLAIRVLCGDFNMVELATDKEGLLPFRWIVGERQA
jgi:hypothetical protein